MGKTTYEKNDNTSVLRPIILQFFTRKDPSLEEAELMFKLGYTWNPVDKKWNFTGTISDAGGEPSTDNRTSAERNKDYWGLSGAFDRWKASWTNDTNPVKGAFNAGLGYVNPVTAVANGLYDIYDSYNLLSSPQGLAKTWGLVKLGNLGRAAISAAGDALAMADVIPGVPETPRFKPKSAPRSIPESVPESVQARPSISERHEVLLELLDDYYRNHVPEEYDPLHYDGSYPLQYYKGIDTPEGLTTDLLLENGILGETSGLFTEELLKNLSPKVLDEFMRRSLELSVEGSHGKFFDFFEDPTKQALQYLLSKGSSSNSIMQSIKKSDRSGYVNFPLSLSIDSWPIWESQSLRHANKTVPISTDLFKKTIEGRLFAYRRDNGLPYAITNMYGIGNRIEASPELLLFLKQNTNNSLSVNDFNIENVDKNLSKILYKGLEVGTLRMLNNEEALNKFNEVRRRLYARDPSKYPGDAVTTDMDFEYMVPFVPTQVKKKGGRLNARLVKRGKK